MSPLTIYNNTQPWTYSIFQISSSLVPPPTSPTHPPPPPNEQTHQLILTAILFACLIGILILLLSLVLASILQCSKRKHVTFDPEDGWEEIEDGGWEEIEHDLDIHEERVVRKLRDEVGGRSLGSLVGGGWRGLFGGKGDGVLVSRRERGGEREVFVVEIETPEEEEEEEGYVSGSASDEEGYEASNEEESGGEMSELIERWRRRASYGYGAVWMEN